MGFDLQKEALIIFWDFFLNFF